MKSTILLSCLGLTLGGCALPAVKSVPVDTTPVTQSTQTPVPTRVQSPQVRSEPQLYARDGSVVGEQRPGTVSVTNDPGQSVATTEGSRWTLLEQYQATLTENEGLQLEVSSLNEALERAAGREEELQRQLDQLTSKLASQVERIAKLEGHNVELASRLTTAQIRRLQSEKLLLEAKLDWKRVETVINSSEASSETVGVEEQLAPAEEPTVDPIQGEQP